MYTLLHRTAFKISAKFRQKKFANFGKIQLNSSESLKKWDFRAVQRSTLCRSQRELSNAYLLAEFGFDTAENEPCKVWQERLRARHPEVAAGGSLQEMLVVATIETVTGVCNIRRR